MGISRMDNRRSICFEESIKRGRDFIIFVKDRQIQRICRAYAESSAGELLGIFSSFGNLEIAINAGNAAGSLGVKRGDSIKIRFQ